MEPAHPPFPTASYFPFQLVWGIQISSLMSESGVGFKVAATRQNEGSFIRTPAAGLTPGAFNWSGRRSAGSVNSPAGTVCARVMDVSGKVSWERASHEEGAASTSRGSNSQKKSAAAVLVP